MKLALKLVSILMAGIFVLLVAGGYLSVRRERQLFLTDMAQDANLFGHAVKGIVADVWRVNGEDAALRLITDMNQQQHPMKVRWVWFDVTQPNPFASIVPPSQLANIDPNQGTSLMGRDSQGHQLLLTYLPVAVVAGRSGALEITESLTAMSSYTRTTILANLLLTATILLLAGVLVTTAGYSMIGRKLQRLMQHARAIGSGHLNTQVQLAGHDELSELGNTMNRMSRQLADSQEKLKAETEARISALVQLRHEDRLRTVGRLASGLAHELGTPLNVVSGRASLITDGAMTPGEITESAAIIKGQAERMTSLIRQLLAFARKGTSEDQRIDLEQVTQQTISLLYPLIQKRKVQLEVNTFSPAIHAIGNTGQIQQVIINILTNAIQAVSEEGHVAITLEQCRRKDPHDSQTERTYARIDVIDDGCGMPEEHLAHIFEPFFTTKGVGEGTGLGLSIAYGIVREHAGWIEVTSKVGAGSQFSIFLPEEPINERTFAHSR